MDTQQIIALTIVAIAGASLGRRVWRQLKGMGDGCGGCGGNCGKPIRATPEGVRSAPEPTPLITLSAGMRPTLPRRPASPKSDT
jgi:hypothetical protein